MVYSNGESMNQKEAISDLKPEDLGMTLDEVTNFHSELTSQWEEKQHDPEYLRQMVVIQSVMLLDTYGKIEALTKLVKPKFTDRLKAKYGRK